jgi:hypothetical protein
MHHGLVGILVGWTVSARSDLTLEILLAYIQLHWEMWSLTAIDFSSTFILKL